MDEKKMKNGDKEYYLLILYKNILPSNSKVVTVFDWIKVTVSSCPLFDALNNRINKILHLKNI